MRWMTWQATSTRRYRKGWTARSLDATFAVSEGEAGLEAAGPGHAFSTLDA